MAYRNNAPPLIAPFNDCAITCALSDLMARHGSPVVKPGTGQRLRDAFQLAFFAKIGLELSEHTQHVEEGLPRGSAGIYRLLGGLQAGTLAFTARTIS